MDKRKKFVSHACTHVRKPRMYAFLRNASEDLFACSAKHMPLEKLETVIDRSEKVDGADKL